MSSYQHDPKSTHPVDVRHPETGRPGLVSPAFIVRIEDLARDYFPATRRGERVTIAGAPLRA